MNSVHFNIDCKPTEMNDSSTDIYTYIAWFIILKMLQKSAVFHFKYTVHIVLNDISQA